MAILGADPDQLEATASRVLARADNYDDASNQIAHWLRRMEWQGPEADRFHATFETQMRPQLGAAAAFLRQAATELRAQATAQSKASQTPEVIGSALAATITRAIQAIHQAGISSLGSEITEDQGRSWLENTNLWFDPFFPTPTGPLGGLPTELPSLLTIANLIGLGTDFFGFGDLAYLRYVNKLPKFGDKLGPFGIGRHLGPNVGKYVGGASAILGAVNLPGHLLEAKDVLDRMGESEYIQPEDMADLLDAGADSIIDIAGIVGSKFPPAGLLIGSFGLGLKAGAQLDTPVIWLVDNVIYPACPELWDTMFEVSDAVTDFAGDVWDAGTDLVGDAAEAVTDFAGDVWDAGTDLVGDAAEAVTDFAGDVWDAGTDLVGDAASFVSDIADDIWPF